MRTKTLLITVALSASCAISSIAQVYSVNAVGYVNDVVPNNFSIHANPLTAANNSLDALLGGGGVGIPDGSSIYKFVNGNFAISTKDGFGQGWFGPDGNPNGSTETLPVGEGFFILNVSGAPFTITWVGEVSQGSAAAGAPCASPAVSISIPNGFSLKASKVPQAGKVQSDLGFPAAPGDSIYKFDPAIQNFKIYTSDSFGSGTPADWLDPDGNPGEPTVGVAEGFFVLTGAAKTWNRNFCVNQ